MCMTIIREPLKENGMQGQGLASTWEYLHAMLGHYTLSWTHSQDWYPNNTMLDLMIYMIQSKKNKLDENSSKMSLYNHTYQGSNSSDAINEPQTTSMEQQIIQNLIYLNENLTLIWTTNMTAPQLNQISIMWQCLTPQRQHQLLSYRLHSLNQDMVA